MKELLVVIDYQNDFVNGALGFEGAEKLDGPIVEKIREYRRRGADVIFTRDTHRENYLETQEGRRLPVVHCIEGSHGHKIFGETAKQVQIGDMIIDKPSFGSVRLAELLRMADLEKPIDRVTLVGLCTDICVISNAMLLKAFLPETAIAVDASCCAGSSPQAHRTALDAMRACQIEIENE